MAVLKTFVLPAVDQKPAPPNVGFINDVRTAIRHGKGTARDVPAKGTLRLEGCV